MPFRRTHKVPISETHLEHFADGKHDEKTNQQKSRKQEFDDEEPFSPFFNIFHESLLESVISGNSTQIPGGGNFTAD